MTNVAIVILNWNGKKYLKKFLPGVIEHSSQDDYEIVIADNASTDDSIIFLENNYPKIRIIKLDKNYGYAQGYNLALEQIESKYYILLNSDIEVTKNWIQPIIGLMDSDESIAACMPKIRSYKDKSNFEYAGAAGGFIDKYGYPFCRGRILDTLEEDTGQYDQNTEVFWATGACLFVRADSFHKAGGLDGDFFAHMEEIDLCWRLKNNGYKIMYSHESTVFHVGGGTLDTTNPFKLFLNYRNNLYLLYKNLHSSELIKTLFIRMILDGISAFVYLLQMQPKKFSVVFKAHISFYKNLNHLKEKRKENLTSGIKSNLEGIYKN